ncbi:hypothetical protein U8V72_20025 [Priestia filamentosa]|uniref:hypothetical protein n=1 Tax=Priestia filamentosa TaxID=1402861 RepID=UPI00397A7DCE
MKRKLTTAEKAEICKQEGYLFNHTTGWHTQVGWQAQKRLSAKEFIKFMKRMGWESNLKGMLRYH